MVKSTVSRLTIILGGLLILAGVGWGLWGRVHAPPSPVITEAGAVVLAVTASPLPAARAPKSDTPTAATTNTAIAPPATETAIMAPADPPAAAVSEPQEQPARLSPPSVTPSSLPTATPGLVVPPPAQNPPTRIVAAAIQLDTQVVEMGWEIMDDNGSMVSQWLVPQDAAGWLTSSALPGHGGNVVLAGHHNIEGKVFRYVVDLDPGDEITLYAGDTPYVYIVAEKYILKEAGMPLAVREKNAQWIKPTADERLTLVTCWPYQWPGNTHRVIVVARPLSTSPQELDDLQ